MTEVSPVPELGPIDNVSYNYRNVPTQQELIELIRETLNSLIEHYLALRPSYARMVELQKLYDGVLAQVTAMSNSFQTSLSQFEGARQSLEGITSDGFKMPTNGDDASQTLQSAVSVAATHRHRRVQLRAGTYSLNLGVTLSTPGMVLEGEGDATIIRGNAFFYLKANDVVFRNMKFSGTSAANIAQLFKTDSTDRQFKNIRFENCTFENIGLWCGWVGAPTVDNAGVFGVLNNATGLRSHVEVDHCKFYGFGADGAVWMRGVDHATVNRCEFYNIGTPANGSVQMTGDMCKFSYLARGGKITHNHFHDGYRDAIDLYDSQGVLVDGNYMENMGVCAIEAKFHSKEHRVGQHTIINNRARNVETANTSQYTVAYQLAVSESIIMGNMIKESNGTGFRFGGAQDNSDDWMQNSTIVGNYAQNLTGHGFSMTGVKYSVMANNISKNNSLRGFYVPSDTATGIVGKNQNISVGNGFVDEWTAAAPTPIP